jgi:DNA-binding response OmpR family regulator
MRQDGHLCPVLFLTARDAVEDRVTGLTLGAGVHTAALRG